MQSSRRREYIVAAASLGAVSTAGCLGAAEDAIEIFGDDAPTMASDQPEPTAEAGEGPPISDRDLPQDYSVGELVDELLDGGPGEDGIPSIDDPVFTGADDPPQNLQDASPVFGIEINGDARAYPQYILVFHEIVNDVVGGEPVAVTYCPLTGTAQGFYRGNIEFGVSGRLVNSNLVMFDRETRTLWPQILAWGIRGPHVTNHLKEFQVIWTTWERWRESHPETRVLTEETRYIRNYGSDPYGSYVPLDGYYKYDYTMFPLLTSSELFPFKEVVIGMRNDEGAMCVLKDQLREHRIVRGRLDDVTYTSVYDGSLDTGYVYRDPEERDIAPEGDGYQVEGSFYGPESLPLERQIAFDAMWMAWYGCYPSTVVHEPEGG